MMITPFVVRGNFESLSRNARIFVSIVGLMDFVPSYSSTFVAVKNLSCAKDCIATKQIANRMTRVFIWDLRLRMRFGVYVYHLFHRNLCVNLRSGKTRVAEEFLNVAKVGAG